MDRDNEQDAPCPASPLRGVLDVSVALDLQRTLLSLADGSPNLCLDFTEVTEIDASAVQLLAALELELGRSGGRLRLTGVSGEVSATLSRAGCGSWPVPARESQP